MPVQSPTARERAILFILMAEASEVSNPSLRDRHKVVLDGEHRRRLNDLEYVESTKVGRYFVHRLTKGGWGWCLGAMADDLPEPSDINGRSQHAEHRALLRYLQRENLELADIFQAAPEITLVPESDVDARIRAAYQALAPSPGDWIRLARLRRHLEDVVQTDLDDALRRLNRAPDVNIVSDADQRRLTPEDRAAALRIGGEDKHLLMVESS